MRYDKELYDQLKGGHSYDNDESFSRNFKDNMRSNRETIFTQVIDYIEENNIEYKQDGSDIELFDFRLQPNMKAFFFYIGKGYGRKGYQYNFEGLVKLIKKRQG